MQRFSHRCETKPDVRPVSPCNFHVLSWYLHYDIIQSNPAISKSQGKWKKKFEIAGLRNNRGSVKAKGKSKGIRSSFEIAGTSN